MTPLAVTRARHSLLVAYLGPQGSWSHQACIDLFGDRELVPMTREELFDAYTAGQTELACIPVTTSIVGVTPYMDGVLDLPEVRVVAEYPKMLGYSLLVQRGSKREAIKEVLAHPVAFEEVKPWLDREMPHVTRIDAASGGAAALAVSQSATSDKASFGPGVGAAVYSLERLVDGIEEGPHNITRWWVLGREMPPPTGHDKTSLLVSISDARFGAFLASIVAAQVQVLTVYERPSKRSLSTHRYLVEVSGHASDPEIARFVASQPGVRVLGSYPRKY